MDRIYQGEIAILRANMVSLINKAGDGPLTLAPVGDIPWLVTGLRATYKSVQASTFSLTAKDSGQTISNDGAAQIITVTLPLSPTPGIMFKFVRVDSFDVRVNPATGSAIKYSGGTMTDGEYLALVSDGAKLHIISDDNGDWIATYEFGTLTEETP